MLKQKIYYVDFSDNIISEKEGESIHQQNDLKNYRKKVEYYLNEHRNSLVVYKLRQNKKLTREEFDELERILWQELGSKEDYQKEFRRNCLIIHYRKSSNGAFSIYSVFRKELFLKICSGFDLEINC